MESSFQIHFCVLAEQSDHKVAVDLVEHNEEEDLIRRRSSPLFAGIFSTITGILCITLYGYT